MTDFDAPTLLPPLDLKEGEAFGAWLIRKVQGTTGTASIFAGDDGRQRHIRNHFDKYAGELVAAVARAATERERERIREFLKGTASWGLWDAYEDAARDGERTKTDG